MAADRSSSDLPALLEAAIEERLAESVEWTLGEADDGYRLSLPDRQIVITPRDGPADGVYWTIALHSDGKIVSKFGPYETVEPLLDQVQTTVTTDVAYTVCCDG